MRFKTETNGWTYLEQLPDRILDKAEGKTASNLTDVSSIQARKALRREGERKNFNGRLSKKTKNKSASVWLLK